MRDVGAGALLTAYCIAYCLPYLDDEHQVMRSRLARTRGGSEERERESPGRFPVKAMKNGSNL
jgi:hypothetical protein